jgi:hypothetical protein
MAMNTAYAPGLKSVFDRTLNAHVVTIDPPNAPLLVTIVVEKFRHLNELNELFLYNFDRDGNCIEFAFGEKSPDIEEKQHLTYEIDSTLYRPPFRIEITHQLDTVRMQDFQFSISYSLLV